MPRCLFTVDDTFNIDGYGLVLAPGLSHQEAGSFRIGDPLSLLRPDKSTLLVAIGNLHIPTPNPQRVWPISIKGLTKKDVPIGTQVWTQEE